MDVILVFHDFGWEVTQIQALLGGNDANAPLLHGQCPEKHFDGFAVFVLSNVVKDVGLRFD
jgi:hypothetical protein